MIFPLRESNFPVLGDNVVGKWWIGLQTSRGLAFKRLVDWPKHLLPSWFHTAFESKYLINLPLFSFSDHVRNFFPYVKVVLLKTVWRILFVRGEFPLFCIKFLRLVLLLGVFSRYLNKFSFHWREKPLISLFFKEEICLWVKDLALDSKHCKFSISSTRQKHLEFKVIPLVWHNDLAY